VIAEASTRLFVGDTSNHRLMVFNVAAVTNGEAAVNVLGQPTFTTNTAATAQTGLRSPRGVAVDASSRLFVADTNNHRIMVFNIASISDGEAAINVLGQANFTSGSSSLAQNRLSGPRGAALVGNLLYIGDSTNNRIVVFDIASITNGENAFAVLGQASFTTQTAATSQTGLRNPSGLVIDPATGRLFVADMNNHRVTIFDVAAITDGENAVNVLGQLNFASGASATTQGRMYWPKGPIRCFVLTTALSLRSGSIGNDHRRRRGSGAGR